MKNTISRYIIWGASAKFRKVPHGGASEVRNINKWSKAFQPYITGGVSAKFRKVLDEGKKGGGERRLEKWISGHRPYQKNIRKRVPHRMTWNMNKSQAFPTIYHKKCVCKIWKCLPWGKVGTRGVKHEKLVTGSLISHFRCIHKIWSNCSKFYVLVFPIRRFHD